MTKEIYMGRYEVGTSVMTNRLDKPKKKIAAELLKIKESFVGEKSGF